MLNIMNEMWNTTVLPPLNTARAAHSSLTTNHKVYLVAGIDDRQVVKSIEVLGLRMKDDGSVIFVSKAWDIFEPTHLTPRQQPLVAPLSAGRLLVYGGLDRESNVLCDGIIINATKGVHNSFEQKDSPFSSLCCG